VNLAAISGVDPADLTPLQRLALAAMVAVEWVLRVLAAVVRILSWFLNDVPADSRTTS
jgi:hypothetical protein